MSTIELTKIASHLGAKCKPRGLHYSYSVVDGVRLDVSIWSERNRGMKILSESVSLRVEHQVELMLLKINEAIASVK